MGYIDRERFLRQTFCCCVQMNFYEFIVPNHIPQKEFLEFLSLQGSAIKFLLYSFPFEQF